MDVSSDLLEVWHSVAAWPDAPPFSGGVFDAWPQRLAQGVALCRAEMVAIREYLRRQQR